MKSKSEIADEVMIFLKSGNAKNGKKIRFLDYVKAVEDSEVLDRAEEELKAIPELSCYRMINEYMDVLYASDGNFCHFFIFHVNSRYLSMSEMDYNEDLNSRIAEALINNANEMRISLLSGMDQESIDEISANYSEMVSKKNGISVKECQYIFYKNSQSRFFSVYRGFWMDKTLLDGFEWKDYSGSHIKLFGLWYYLTVYALSCMHKNHNGSEGLSIHDAGACKCYFGLVLAADSGNELKNFSVSKIISSDLKSEGEEFALRFLSEIHSEISFECIKRDFTDRTADLPESDYVISIDVMEHLNSENDVVSALENLWKSAKKGMIIHVPFEEQANRMHGHNITFNRGKLENYANMLPGCELLKENVPFGKHESYLEFGFLVLRRVSDVGRD